MINQLNVTKIGRKKRGTKPKNKPHKNQTTRNFMVVSESEEETDHRPLSQKRNRRQDQTERSPKQKKTTKDPHFWKYRTERSQQNSARYD
jgi:hypothetical protein